MSQWIGPVCGVAVGALLTLAGTAFARRTRRGTRVVVVRKAPGDGDGA